MRGALPEPGSVTPAVLDPVPENTCPRCGAAGAPKAGVCKNRNYDNQTYKCRSCGRKFSANRPDGEGRRGGGKERVQDPAHAGT